MTKLWTALITPLLENSQVDYDSLSKLLKDQDDAGNGILILGSTGEALNLSEKDRKEIIDFTFNQKINTPIMVGVGGFDLEQTISWIEFLEVYPAHSYLLVTPLYAKPGDHGQLDWFKALMDKSSRPCMLYNIPGRTGQSLSKVAVKALVDHKNYWSLKEASGSEEEFKIYTDCSSKLEVFSGDDALLPNYIKFGCKGLVSVASNIWPKQTSLYVELALAGELSAQEIKLWHESSNTLFIASNPIPAKTLMRELGIIKSAKTKAPLSEKDFTEFNELIKANERINNWFNERKK